MSRAGAALCLVLISAGLAWGREPLRQETARRELRQILSRPEFQDARPGGRRGSQELEPPGWMQKWTDFVRRALRKIRDLLFPPRAAGEDPSPGDALLSRGSLPGVIAVIALLLSALVLLIVRKTRSVARFPSAAAEPAGAAADDAQARDATGWEAEAEQLLAAGRFREAVRARYLGTLSFLSERGAIRYERFKTNWEYARDLSGSAEEFRTGFERLTSEFDLGWYGDKSLDGRAAREFFASEAQWRRGFRP